MGTLLILVERKLAIAIFEMLAGKKSLKLTNEVASKFLAVQPLLSMATNSSERELNHRRASILPMQRSLHYER